MQREDHGAMSTRAPSIARATVGRSLSPYRFTVAQYHRMIDTNVLTANDRVELLDGVIVPKMVHKPPHVGTIGRINRVLMRLPPDAWILRVQSAITLATGEPEPDFVIARGPEEVYFKRQPTSRDIALVIEVADATLLDDRKRKGSLYAAGRIPVYWNVDLVQARIEIHTNPKGGKLPTYRQRHDNELKDDAPLVLDGREIARIAVRKLLP
jgi:hypothetical protein